MKTLGIIGGGQLGRMLTEAASRLNISTIVLDPTPKSPAGQITEQIVGDYKDKEQIKKLGKIQKKIYIALAFIFLGVILFCVISYFTQLSEFFQKVIKFFAAGSGLFGFVSMVITITKYWKENRKK